VLGAFGAQIGPLDRSALAVAPHPAL